MAKIGIDLNRTVSLLYDAAVVAANLDFVAVSLRGTGGEIVHVSGIDVNIFADTADAPNIDLITVQILRNVPLVDTIAIASQIPSQTLVWRLRSRQTNDRSFTTRFVQPLKLRTDAVHSVLAFVNFTAAIVAPVTIDLTVLGEYGTKETGKYFGESR